MKLTEDDIQIEEGFLVIPNNLFFDKSKELKQQILENQKLRELVEEYYKAAKKNTYQIDKELCLVFEEILRRSRNERLHAKI